MAGKGNEEKFVTEKKCSENSNNCRAINLIPLMNEVKEIKTEIKEVKEDVKALNKGQNDILLGMKDIAGDIFREIDGKYATKDIEDTVRKLVDKQEQRTYDWLKFAIVTFVSVIIAVAGSLFASIKLSNSVKSYEHNSGGLSREEIIELIDNKYVIPNDKK